MHEMEILGPNKQRKEIDWRHLFTEEQLKAAADPKQISGVKFSTRMYYYRSAIVTCGPASTLYKGRKLNVTIRDFPRDLNDHWDADNFICPCKEGRISGQVCLHDAAVMLAWEKEMGGRYSIEEEDWEYRQRQEREKRYLQAVAYRESIEENAKNFIPVSDILKMAKPKGLVLYDRMVISPLPAWT